MKDIGMKEGFWQILEENGNRRVHGYVVTEEVLDIEEEQEELFEDEDELDPQGVIDGGKE